MSFSFVPAGTMLPFAGATAPSGWLLCDGSAISRTIYAALFANLSTAWGYGDNSTTFSIPDMRGRFPRGRDGGAARDPDRATRTASNTGGNTGDAVGSVQTHATAKNGLGVTNGAVTSDPENRSHTHSPANGTLFFTNEAIAGVSGAASGCRQAQEIGSPAGGSASQNHTHSVTSNVTLGAGDSETRPINANVNYIIKI